MTKSEPSSVIGSSPEPIIVICDRCGTRMEARHCKIICPNCGCQFDCSDLTIHFD